MHRSHQPQSRKEQEDILCLNCYQTGHRRQDPCPNSSLIGCSNCLRREVLTSMCNCKDHDKPDPPQTLRFVKGKSGGVLIFIDVEIRGKYFETVINTRAEETLIGNSVYTWLLQLGYSSKDERRITVPIKVIGPALDLKCKIQKFLEYPIEIGTDFIFSKGFTFGLFNVFLDSRRSPVANTPNEVNYLYDLVPDGLALRRYLERKGQLPSTRNNQSTVRKYQRQPRKSISPKSTFRKLKKETPSKAQCFASKSIEVRSDDEPTKKRRRSISPNRRSSPRLKVKSQVSPQHQSNRKHKNK